MEFVWTFPGVINSSTAILFVILGALVAFFGPGRRLNLAFAAFAMAWGVHLAYLNVLVGPYPPPLRWLDYALNLTAAAGLVLLGIWIGPRASPTKARTYLLAAGVALAATIPYWVATIMTALMGTVPEVGIASGKPTLEDILASSLVYSIFRGAWWFTLALLALRFSEAGGPRRNQERRTYALVSAALIVYAAAFTALLLLISDWNIGGWATRIAGATGLLSVVALWIRNTVGTQAPASGWARNLAILAVGSTLLGILINVTWTFEAPWYGPEFGVARTIGFALLAYTILRHQLFGIELQAKRVVRVGTVVATACAIVGGILLAGFALTSGNPWAVGAAAFAVGVVVVFLLRDRILLWGGGVAEAAMPHVAPSPEYYTHRKFEIYSAALGDVPPAASPTPDQGDFLRRLRRQLGISDEEDRFLRVLTYGREETGGTKSGPPLDTGRLQPYLRALQRELSAGLPSGEVASRLKDLRSDLGISDREHAILELALQSVRSPAGVDKDLGPGRLFLGRYRVERLLGQGGFARTFLCHDEQAGRDVVLKVLRSASGATEGVQAVLREARAIAAIQHPRVVTMYDVERLGEDAFIFMEHLPGRSLKDRLAEGGLPQDAFMQMARDVLEGLGAVHEAGLVHGDVKPSNILFTRDGRAKLADFGIAHFPGFETTAGPDPGSGSAVGTIRYMSPEAARGRRVTLRSDLYSAAATLYEAFTGEPHVEAQAGESALEMQMRVANAGPFPRRWPGPARMGRWFQTALDPSPDRRFGGAAEMLEALEGAMSPTPRTPTMPLTIEAGLPGKKA